MGQLVKVRNSTSQKIVEGIVTGEGLVKVNL
jgi:flagella basal body P-ring formation protein FlgA